MKSDDYIQFIDLYSRHQKKIYLYILGMVHRVTDAEDIMQQTSMEMWRLFDHYDENASFAAWGVSIARYRILHFRRDQRKNSLFLSEEVYRLIQDELEQSSDAAGERAEALRHCLKRLKDADRKLLDLHYNQGLKYRMIAKQYNLSLSGIYKVMARVHGVLHSCIRKTVLSWEMEL